MKKLIPLFVDSTRSSNEAIVTNVELKQICPYLGETVYMKVTDRKGENQLIRLERADQDQCTGFLFLRHQQEITYQFFVAREGRAIFETEPRNGKASYLIEEVWKPRIAYEGAQTFLGETEDPTPVESVEPEPEILLGSGNEIGDAVDIHGAVAPV